MRLKYFNRIRYVCCDPWDDTCDGYSDNGKSGQCLNYAGTMGHCECRLVLDRKINNFYSIMLQKIISIIG
jgi:hypothetical protein